MNDWVFNFNTGNNNRKVVTKYGKQIFKSNFWYLITTSLKILA
jgi:hypothetical protein